MKRAGYEIQIKQRSGGKWVMWCTRATKAEIDSEWSHIPSIRRAARCRRIADGVSTVLARYSPPELT